MALPQAKLDAQHAVIVTALGTLSTTKDAYIAAADAYDAAPDAGTLAAKDAADLALEGSRKDLASEVARVVQILVEDPGYSPPAGASAIYDIVYQIVLALGKGF